MQKKLHKTDAICPAPLEIKTPLLLAYIPMKTEVNITLTIDKALADGINVAVPMQTPGVFSFIEKQWKDSLIKSENGVYVPSYANSFLLDSICSDVTILVPGLAFTSDGKRLGRGMGFYDRVLSILYGNTGYKVFSIGICRSFQVVDNLPVDSNDMPVESVISF